MKEEEIRPQRIFDEYLRLAKKDTEVYFSDVETIMGACPACDSLGEPAFNIKDRFWRTFAETVTDAEKESLQQTIAATGFSSHMMVVCWKL